MARQNANLKNKEKATKAPKSTADETRSMPSKRLPKPSKASETQIPSKSSPPTKKRKADTANEVGSKGGAENPIGGETGKTIEEPQHSLGKNPLSARIPSEEEVRRARAAHCKGMSMNALCAYIGKDACRTLEECGPVFKDPATVPPPKARLTRKAERGTIIYQVVDLRDRKA